MSEITSLNGYKICDKQARTQVEEAVEQIEESKTQINTLSQANESALAQIENIQTQIENIQTQSAGSVTQPIYFNNGEPIATTYALNATVPSGAKFTDTTYSAATTSAAGLMSASDKTKLNATTDYITAQGTSGIWTYRKWASGIKECWGTYSFSGTFDGNTWGNMYVGRRNERISYPFSFSSRPMENIVGRCATNAAWIYPDSGGLGLNTTTSTGCYTMARPLAGNSESQTMYFDFYIIGK